MTDDEPVRLEPSEALTMAFLLDVVVFVAAAALGFEGSVLSVGALALANVLALGYAGFEFIRAGLVVEA